ncbi:YbaK/EbsC family protein [Palaeococcus sp. (in: euryarchaeotes)]|uniref:aminoacyl-tRNA deacylase n=1 Tax=Palaeococcus sp. (in: euryarchaeotes) TaxID=2820298 RepID=UPI0025FE224C|nr:YbaK/EbsC family protein [Palaeococcus sp. (in: euryarchaeotes)]
MNLEELASRLGGEILNIGKPVKTVKQAVRETKSAPKQIIKSLIFISEKEPLLVIVDGDSKVSLEKLKNIFGDVRLAKPKEVKELTGYEVGGVPPVGIALRTIVDPKVLENDYVIGGGGSIDKLMKISPKKIVEHQRAEIIDVSL